MNKEKVLSVIRWVALIALTLWVYLLIYEKLGRAQSSDELVLSLAAENLVLEPPPLAPDKPPTADSGHEEKTQYQPKFEGPVLPLKEKIAPLEKSGGATYPAGADLYVDPRPDVSLTDEPIVEERSDSAVQSETLGGQK